MLSADRVSESDYLTRERAAVEKHEYVNGMVLAMSGASFRHNVAASNVNRALGDLLRDRPCFVMTSDQRVHVEATRLYTYPDVIVVCDRPRMHPRDDHTLLNPTLLVEVLSPSTEAYDRGAKFRHYQSIPSLAEYLLVGSIAPLIEHYQRMPTGQWLLTTYDAPGSKVALPALAVELPFDDVYAKWDLLPEE